MPPKGWKNGKPPVEDQQFMAGNIITSITSVNGCLFLATQTDIYKLVDNKFIKQNFEWEN